MKNTIIRISQSCHMFNTAICCVAVRGRGRFRYYERDVD
jgi:hypothetical protein